MIFGSLAFTLIFWALIIILSYLLFTPVSIRLAIKFDESVAAVPELRIFPFKYKIRKTPSGEEPEEPTKEKRVKTAKVKGGLDFSRLNRADMSIIFKLLMEILRYLGRSVKAPKYFLKAEIAGGAAEPDVTGELYGAYQALRYVLPSAVSVSYSPDFTAEKFSGRVEVGLAFRLSRILRETLVFVFRLPIIKLIRLYRKLRIGGKNG